MWQPEAGWQRLPGSGPSTLGVWAAQEGEHRVVVKRLVSPGPDDDAVLSQPRHPAYWRRAADVALSGVVAHTSGLREPEVVRVVEDTEGFTLVHTWVEDHPHSGSSLARALGRFAANDVPDQVWGVRGLLDARIEQVAHRGGWATLSRTPVADLTDALWQRRGTFLAQLAAMPQVVQHGDPVPSNLRGTAGEDVVTIDWATLGHGPHGGDLGYLALSVAEDLPTLLAAYVEGAAAGLRADEVGLAARITAVFTVLTRADWALSRVASREGGLAGSYRHPSVAPYIRAVQRQLPLIDALLAA